MGRCNLACLDWLNRHKIIYAQYQTYTSGVTYELLEKLQFQDEFSAKLVIRIKNVYDKSLELYKNHQSMLEQKSISANPIEYEEITFYKGSKSSIEYSDNGEPEMMKLNMSADSNEILLNQSIIF